MPKRIMIQCRSNVKKDAIRRESINGVEHIIVSSMTMPDDIVMNRGLYPAEEINKSFHTLERTLAPVEHPSDNNGQFLSASDPEAIHNFHAGAFNMNVEKEGNRIKVDKYINVQEAQKTDRGLRLLDRINEIETSNDPRPIHTSTGIFLEVEPMGEAMENDDGLEYDWVARNMVFDHDAILLDSVGAAQPHQGVGMAVNGEDEYEVQSFEVNADESEEEEKTEIKTRDSRTNQDGVSLSELHQKVFEALEKIGLNVMYIEELFDSEVIFQAREELFTVPYRIDNGMVTIVGIPVPVERVVSFNPKQNSKGEAMKDLILNYFKKHDIEVNDQMTDDELFAKYNEHLQANQETGNDSDDNGASDQIATAIENALKPVADKLESLEGTINAQADKDLEKYAETVANSGKYPGLDADSAKSLGLEKLKEMAANCGSSFGVSPVFNSGSKDDKFDLSSLEMPK